jgi:hypothetical protein
MKKILLVSAALAVLAPLAAQAQSDAEARCRSDVANRGYGGYSIERVQVSGGSVTGTMRSGNDVLAFNCLVDNSGNVMEVRVDRTVAAVDRNSNAAEYERGYRDAMRKAPYNNYGNSGDYERGYDAGAQQRWQRR